jgi:hypothetical protein
MSSLGVADHDLVDLVGRVDDLDVVGRLARGALDLLVAVVTDEEDVVVVLREPHGFLVHLGHQGAGRVDGVEVARGGRRADGRRDAVRREHEARALGHLVGLVHEDRAAVAQRLHDVLVVHDLLAHVHRGAVGLEGLLDRHDGTVDAGAVAARRGEQHALGRGGGVERGGRSHVASLGAGCGRAVSGAWGMLGA